MARKKTQIPNKFIEVWHPERFSEPVDWHEKIIGIYHISVVGCDHQDLEPDEHSGPCLRTSFWDYIDAIPDDPESEGNFEMGRDLHEKWQKLVKEWYPHADIERTVAKIFTRFEESILLVGSEDVHMPLLFNLAHDTSKTKRKREIWDGKSASEWTLPKGRYDKNPTHFDQPYIYGGMEILFELNMEHNEIKRIKVYYFDKHNKGTYIQREHFEPDVAVDKLGDCVDRAFYLHACLVSSKIPNPEPHKWCKYCRYISRCKQAGGIEIINNKDGSIKKVIRSGTQT